MVLYYALGNIRALVISCSYSVGIQLSLTNDRIFVVRCILLSQFTSPQQDNSIMVLFYRLPKKNLIPKTLLHAWEHLPKHERTDQIAFGTEISQMMSLVGELLSQSGGI